MKTLIGQDGIVAALSEMERERANLRTRLEKLESLIALMRDTFHLPAPPTAAVRDGRARKARRAADGDRRKPRDAWPSDDRVRAALRSGPLSPGKFAAAVGLEPYSARKFVNDLVDREVVSVSGETAGRRIALPAKEAP